MITTTKSPKSLLRFHSKHSESWKELQSRHVEFQRILRLLVNDQEKEQNANLSWLFNLRKAACLCESWELRVFMKHLGGYLYHIVVEIESLYGNMITTWLHEDGIQSERDMRFTEQDHPVHQLLCMCDLYNDYARKVALSEYDKSKWPRYFTLNMMSK